MTGLGVPGLLRASHIKAWSQCESDEERLDVFNGLLLGANLDALFDSGWISFSPEGEFIVSTELADHQRDILGIPRRAELKGLTDAHQQYLKWHRANLFKS